MTKKAFKSLMIGFCVFIGTLIISSSVYMLFTKSSPNESHDILAAENQAAAANSSTDLGNAAPNADYYMARCDGHTLSIYACTDGREEFLYTIDARIEDIPQYDLAKLAEGIMLVDRSSLASFEEDFGS